MCESPYYNSTVLTNIDAINAVKVNTGGCRRRTCTSTATFTTTTSWRGSIIRSVIISLSFVRYFFNDQRSTNLSPLNDGFDLPSGFKNNTFRDQSIVGNLFRLSRPHWSTSSGCSTPTASLIFRQPAPSLTWRCRTSSPWV